ncbi:hypothetical protein BC835DRAFT_92212 [Cytidiella melzeri]|nr:hypothetical protein BC835DRAFT_92212 [Cytidiella melzeri]
MRTPQRVQVPPHLLQTLHFIVAPSCRPLNVTNRPTLHLCDSPTHGHHPTFRLAERQQTSYRNHTSINRRTHVFLLHLPAILASLQLLPYGICIPTRVLDIRPVSQRQSHDVRDLGRTHFVLECQRSSWQELVGRFWLVEEVGSQEVIHDGFGLLAARGERCAELDRGEETERRRGLRRQYRERC